MKQRLLNILIALDQFLWVILTLGNGQPDETISAALYRMETQGKPAGKLFRPLVDWLFWFDPKHCQNSYNAEFKKLQLPDSYR
jgi:hypothetical protein